MSKLSEIKYTKSEVDYTDHTSHKDKCKLCRHFVPTHACQLVAGEISSGGWCKEFEKG